LIVGTVLAVVAVFVAGAAVGGERVLAEKVLGLTVLVKGLHEREHETSDSSWDTYQDDEQDDEFCESNAHSSTS
jgi:hypothetical protein